jgi:hypothetical protein
VVAKRYCIQDAVVPYTVEEGLSTDALSDDVANTIFAGIPVKDIICKIRDYRRIGKDASCEIEKLFYLQMLAEYMLVVKEEARCGSDKGFDDLSEEFKLDCIRDILTCNYGLGDLMNDLVELLGLRTPYNGISYMVINADLCNPFIIYGE